MYVGEVHSHCEEVGLNLQREDLLEVESSSVLNLLELAVAAVAERAVRISLGITADSTVTDIFAVEIRAGMGVIQLLVERIESLDGLQSCRLTSHVVRCCFVVVNRKRILPAFTQYIIIMARFGHKSK